MRLANGLPWTHPRHAGRGMPLKRRGRHDVALYDPQGAVRGVLHVADVYGYDKRHEARRGLSHRG